MTKDDQRSSRNSDVALRVIFDKAAEAYPGDYPAKVVAGLLAVYKAGQEAVSERGTWRRLNYSEARAAFKGEGQKVDGSAFIYVTDQWGDHYAMPLPARQFER